MRRNTFLILMLTAIVALFSYSCDDGNEGAIFDVKDGVHASFASIVQVVEMLPADGNKIQVPVYRGGKNDAEVTVPVKLALNESVPEGTFVLSNQNIAFKAGENVAYAVITYESIELLSASAVYEMSLEIVDASVVSVSNLSKISIKANRKLTFKDFGTGTFNSEFFEDAWEVLVLKAEEANVFKVIDPYYEGFPVIFSVATDNSISFLRQPMGYVHPDHGMASITMPTADNEFQPSRDGNTFNLWSRFVVSAGSFGHFHEFIVMD